MKRYTVIITNGACGDLESFNTLEEAQDEIERQHIMDAEADADEPDGDRYELRYAIRDNERDEIVWAE